MGYEDAYYRQPWTPNGDMRQQMNLGLDSLGKVPMANAQLQAQQQANKDAAYTAPGAEASPHRALLGKYVQGLLQSTPGHTPEFEQRFMSEAGNGGLNTPQAQYMPDGNMVQQVPQNQGPGQYQSYQPDYSAPQGLSAPQPQQPQQPVNIPTNNMPGQGGLEPQATRSTHSVTTETRKPLPASTAFAAQRNPPASDVPTTPMTNYDVDSYMKAMGHVVKPNMDADKLAEKKREFDAMMDFRGRALAAKERLGKLAAAAKESTADNDRKRAIELLRIEVDREKAGVLAQAKVYSGLYGIVNEQGTQAYLNYLDSFITDAQSGAGSAETSPQTQPIQTMGGGGPKPAGPPKPRPLNKDQPSQYTAGQVYDAPPDVAAQRPNWKGKARFKGYDKDKNALWGAP